MKQIWFYRLGLSLLFTAILMRPLECFDTWWHLDIGRWILANRQLLEQDVRSYTVFGAPMTNVAWLFQIYLAVFYQLFGLWGVLIAHGLLVFLFLLTLAASNLRTREDVLPLALVFVLFEPHWFERSYPRPHLVEYWCMAMLIGLMGWRTTRTKMVLMATVLLLWSNTHGSAVVGVGTAGLHWLFDKEPRSAMPNPIHRLLVAVLFGGVAFCTPIGVQLVELVLATTDQGGRLGIGEWQAPAAFPHFLFVLGVGYLVALLSRSYRFSIAELVLFLFCFHEAGLYLRSSSQLAIVLVAPACWMVTGVYRRLEPNWGAIRWVFILVLIYLFAAQYGLPTYLAKPEQWNQFPIHRRYQPVAVTQVVARMADDSHAPLKILNDYNYGGYLGFYLGDRVRVQADGRASMVYPPEVVIDNYSAINSAKGIRRFADRDQIRVILLGNGRRDEKRLLIPEDDPEWQLAAFDWASVLYVRRGSAWPVPLPDIRFDPETLPLVPLKEGHDEAVAAVRALLELAPDNPWASAHLGALLSARPEASREIQAQAAGELERGWQGTFDPVARVLASRALMKSGAGQEAVARLATVKDPPPHLENLMAEVYLEQGRFEQVLSMLDPGKIGVKTRLDQHFLTWIHRALAYEGLNLPERAREALRRARGLIDEVDPDQGRLLKAVGDRLGDGGR